MEIFSKASNQDKLDEFFGGVSNKVSIDPKELAEFCKTKVMGQDLIIDDLAMSVSRRAKLNRKNKPLGVFLFVGPTGVGKTELCKALADGAFKGRLIRHDMAEFNSAASVNRLVGSPSGYCGSDKGGALPQAIRANGSGVILFDEIEKAHEDVKKILLGLLDEGRITESSTNFTADASKFIIIMTSNAAHKELGDISRTIDDVDELRRAIKDTLRQSFAPEILGRIDDVFCFKPLSRKGISDVIIKHLHKLEDDIGIQIREVDGELLMNTVLRHEKAEDFGIRELLRLVEREVVDGMLECREMGYKKVRIEVEDQVVKVKGIEEKVANSNQSQSLQQFSNS